jgi:hypothetical protein
MVMENLLEAKRLRRNYRRRLTRLRHKSLLERDNEAARQMIHVLIEYENKLKAIGFRLAGGGKVVPRTEEWAAEQKAKMTAIDRLQEEVRKNPTPEKIKNFIHVLATTFNED